MAFDRANWSPIGGQSKRGKAPQMWSYTTTDAKTVVDGAGYFNDVSGDVMGGDNNQVTWVTASQTDNWPSESKVEVASRIARQISQTIATTCNEDTPT